MIFWIVACIVAATLGVFVISAFTGAPYVPSMRRELKELFDELRPITERDLLVDIGSGDGAVLLEVASRGARSLGYEINPYLVLVSRFRLRAYRKQATVRMANYWRVAIPDDTTVVYVFGDSRDIVKMYEKIEQEATRIGRTIDFVSYGFKVPGRQLSRKHRAHFLYHITPLHKRQA